MLDLSSAPSRKAALSTFFKIARAWQCDQKTELSLLSIGSCESLSAMKAGDDVPLSHDQLLRISYVFGIDESLHGVVENIFSAFRWHLADNMLSNER